MIQPSFLQIALSVILLGSFIAYLVTTAIMPFLIDRMTKRGITGKDMNKYSKPPIPEMGGIGVFFGFTAGVTSVIGVLSYFNYVKPGSIELNLTSLLAAFLTILVIGFIGVFDDLIGWKNGIRKWQHALLPVFAALPLIIIPQTISTTSITLPLIGSVYVGIFYSLFFIPLGVTGASNAVNMLAGFNGLEAGLGSILSFSMLLAFVFLPFGGEAKIEAIILMASMLGALIAFLKFNWFPAKIFGGDSLTLMIGAGIAAASIIGGLEKIAFMFFILYFLELAFKSRHKMQSECYGIPQKDGTLKPDPRGGSLTQAIMKSGKGNLTEKQVVANILAIQAITCVTVLVLAFLGVL